LGVRTAKNRKKKTSTPMRKERGRKKRLKMTRPSAETSVLKKEGAVEIHPEAKGKVRKERKSKGLLAERPPQGQGKTYRKGASGEPRGRVDDLSFFNSEDFNIDH